MVAQILDAGDKLIGRISEQTKKSREEIEELIKTRQSEYGGLLTEAGAAYSVAKDLNVETGFEVELTLGELKADCRNANTSGTIVSTYKPREFSKNGRNGKFASIEITDGKATRRVLFWNERADEVAKLAPNQKVKIKNANVRENRNGEIELHLNERSEISAVSVS